MNALPTIGIFLALCAASCKGPVAPPRPAPGSEEITFKAADGVTIYADLYKALPKDSGVLPLKTIVLLFHQAGSNAKEYAPIAPRVIKLGIDCLAVDQRSGGNMFNAPNRTQMHAGGKVDYMAAYQDMQAALEWAQDQKYQRIIVWGSSYSASLVLRLASENSSVYAVLSFSPGEYFDQKGLVAGWNAAVKAPVFIACTGDEKTEQVQAIVEAANPDPVRKANDVLFTAPEGVHGSSTLHHRGKGESDAAYWAATEKFLNNVLASHRKDGTRGPRIN